jgi:hypothetical protein
MYIYKKMKLSLLEILKESEETEFEYQICYIDGPVFYKRKKGDDVWLFTNAEEFAENAHKSKIIKWKEKNPND